MTAKIEFVFPVYLCTVMTLRSGDESGEGYH